MTFQSIACVSVIFIASAFTPLLVAAECVRLSAKDMAKRVMEDKTYEAVFSGTVVAIDRTADFGYRATFDVERVWKGAVTTRFDLYVWELNPEIPRFEVGQRYLALARRSLTAREREGAGISSSDKVAFTPVQCSDPPSVDPDLVRYLGAGLRPKPAPDRPFKEDHPDQDVAWSRLER